jgi:hypothetical protein
MKKHLKFQAIELRNEGYSYNLISKKLKIGKGTLSAWLREVPFKPNYKVLARIKNGPLKSGLLKHRKKVKEIKIIKKKAKVELGKISERDLWMLGLGLYLGEGSKLYEITRIINSDPKIIKMSIEWFKKICKLKDNNITIAIHLYPDNNEEKCLRYWSENTGVPLKQFRKTQVDYRKDKSKKKKRKLPFGTAHVTIIGNGNPDFGVNLHRRIMGWIDAINNQI